jgi:predicted MFS family arabinose efflux permease
VPVGIATLWLTLSRTENVRDPGATRLDVAGLLTFSVAMFLLIFGFIRANSDGWTSTTIISLFTASLLMFVLFVVAELHQQRPMFDLSLFRRPSFSGVSIATFAIAGGMFAMYPYLTFYLQNDLGFSPIVGGLCLLPSTVPTFVVPIVFRSRAERLAPRAVLGGGLAVCAAGLFATLAVSTTSGWLVLIPGLVLTGIGVGIANPAIARVALGVVAPERSGMASGISNTFRTAGLATGVAALGAIFQREVTSSLTAHLGAAGPGLAKIVASGGVHAAVVASSGRAGVATAAHAAFVSGLELIVVVGAVVVSAGAVVAYALVRQRDFQGAPARNDTEVSTA